MADIEGRLVPFPDGRMVFLAEDPKKPNTFLIAFKSKEGKDLKLKLSGEALDALVALRTDPVVGTPARTYPHEPLPKVWQLVASTG